MKHHRAFANLERKISESVGHRVDVQLSDARRINANTAEFILEYTDEHPPSSDDMNQFFIRKFNAKIRPLTSTARIYPNKRAMRVMAQMIKITRDYEDIQKSSMVPVIQGAVYLDVPLKETWEVNEVEGKKVLVRKVKDDIMALVAARKQVMLDSSSSRNVTFASLAQGDLTRYLHMVEKGDQVRVFIEDKILDAEVLSVSDAEIRVRHKSGTESVPKTAIVDITAKNPKDEQAYQKEAVDYYTRAYGDEEYAKNLVL